MIQLRRYCRFSLSSHTRPIKRLLYVSSGNIPSRVTHTIQIMRMAEAFGLLSQDFSLLTASDAVRWWRGDAPVLSAYGVAHPFRIQKLVLGPLLPQRMFDRSSFPKFGHIARPYIRLLRPDVVYTRSHQTAEFAIRDGFEVVFETHDGGSGHPWTMDFIAKCKDAPNFRGIVTTSETLKDMFVEAGVQRNKVLAWPNGVDLERFDLAANARAAARRMLGLPEDRFVVVYAGSLVAYKGIPTLLKAARRTPDVDFLLIGGTEPEIAKWVEFAQHAPNLRFVSRLPNPELPRYLAAADAFVVPNSYADPTAGWTFSLKLYEYLASRRPTIVSAIPSLCGIVTDEENALVVPADDSYALSTAIMRLKRDPALRCSLAEAGYQLVKQFTWKRRALQILETFAPECLNGHTTT
jgi:glycosyltransferase involved in cell wall biosynthesis